jgi:hypothetical protein
MLVCELSPCQPCCNPNTTSAFVPLAPQSCLVHRVSTIVLLAPLNLKAYPSPLVSFFTDSGEGHQQAVPFRGRLGWEGRA